MRLIKGYLILQPRKLRGMDLCIVWLKRDVPSGEPFELCDVDKIETIMHFCDRKSVENMINGLKQMLEMRWGDEEKECQFSAPDGQ